MSGARTMKAAVVQRPGVLEVVEVPVPPVGDYDARCEMCYGATCTGTDQHIIHGRIPWTVPYPVILGHESVGRVVETGSKVRHLKPGDLITRVGAPAGLMPGLDVSWGGFVEYGVARDHRAAREDGRPKEEWNAFRVNQVVPEGIGAAEATMIITWRETLSHITRMGVGAGASVLVLGSGGNGLAFVAHAKNLGAECVAAVGSAARRDTAFAAGAGVYLDYRDEQLAERLAEAWPEGFDFIIDAVGKAGQIDRVLGMLRPGGTVTVYGIDDFNGIAINPRLAKGTFTYFNGGYDEEETHEQVVSLMQSGALDPSVWLDLDCAFPLTAIGEAFEVLQQRKMVKALIDLAPRKG